MQSKLRDVDTIDQQTASWLNQSEQSRYEWALSCPRSTNNPYLEKNWVELLNNPFATIVDRGKVYAYTHHR